MLERGIAANLPFHRPVLHCLLELIASPELRRVLKVKTPERLFIQYSRVFPEWKVLLVRLNTRS